MDATLHDFAILPQEGTLKILRVLQLYPVLLIPKKVRNNRPEGPVLERSGGQLSTGHPIGWSRWIGFLVAMVAIIQSLW